jgi:hypothetical protein
VKSAFVKNISVLIDIHIRSPLVQNPDQLIPKKILRAVGALEFKIQAFGKFVIF